MPWATAHKLTSLCVAALLLFQYAPLTVFKGEGVSSKPCSHCNETYCLRTAQGKQAKCPHHSTGHANHSGANHSGTSSHHASPAAGHTSVAHDAHGTHHAPTKGTDLPTRSVFLVCGCNSHSPSTPYVLAVVDKVVVDGTVRVRPRSPRPWRFAAYETAKPDRFATEHFHPPRVQV